MIEPAGYYNVGYSDGESTNKMEGLAMNYRSVVGLDVHKSTIGFKERNELLCFLPFRISEMILYLRFFRNPR